jgi:hypothetical protein
MIATGQLACRAQCWLTEPEQRAGESAAAREPTTSIRGRGLDQLGGNINVVPCLGQGPAERGVEQAFLLVP